MLNFYPLLKQYWIRSSSNWLHFIQAICFFKLLNSDCCKVVKRKILVKFTYYDKYYRVLHWLCIVWWFCPTSDECSLTVGQRRRPSDVVSHAVQCAPLGTNWNIMLRDYESAWQQLMLGFIALFRIRPPGNIMHLISQTPAEHCLITLLHSRVQYILAPSRCNYESWWDSLRTTE